MIAIVFANEREAEPFLKNYQRGRFEGVREGEITQDSQFIVTITGPGKIKATLITERLLQTEHVKRLIHPGACSSLSEDPKTGNVYGITQVFEGDRVELSAPTYPRMPLEVPFSDISGATLVTQDHTPDESSEQSYWQRIADLRDNTSYAVAYVAATHGVPCHVVKVALGLPVTKHARLDTPQKEALDQFSHYLIGQLETL